MSNLTALQVNEEEKYVWVGPGHNWGQVFSYLSQYNLTCAGGRLSPVGVPGLLLAGGVNFQGNQHGWAADNVIEYEIVLADGTCEASQHYSSYMSTYLHVYRFVREHGGINERQTWKIKMQCGT